MGFKFYQDYSNVWIVPAVKYYGMENHEYILVYVDGLLAVYMSDLEVLQKSLMRCQMSRFISINLGESKNPTT